jgi:uncharacterized protein YndB with AHSA1/START domain
LDGPDAIERELILPVPRERVWAALTQPDRLSAWFGTQATVDLRPGGALTFIWDNAASGEQFTNTGVIEVVEPPSRFVFRWHVADGVHAEAPPDGPTTRVEFTLDDHPEGTRLRLVETGFAGLADAARDGNTRGWQNELGELAAYLTAAADV